MGAFGNSADPYETARMPSHQDLHCFNACYLFVTEALFETMDVSEFSDGIVYLETEG